MSSVLPVWRLLVIDSTLHWQYISVLSIVISTMSSLGAMVGLIVASTVTPIDQQGLKWSHGLLGGNGAPTTIIEPSCLCRVSLRNTTIHDSPIANGDVDPVPFHRTTVIAPWATQQREWWLWDSSDAQQSGWPPPQQPGRSQRREVPWIRNAGSFSSPPFSSNSVWVPQRHKHRRPQLSARSQQRSMAQIQPHQTHLPTCSGQITSPQLLCDLQCDKFNSQRAYCYDIAHHILSSNFDTGFNSKACYVRHGGARCARYIESISVTLALSLFPTELHTVTRTVNCGVFDDGCLTGENQQHSGQVPDYWFQMPHCQELTITFTLRVQLHTGSSLSHKFNMIIAADSITATRSFHHVNMHSAVQLAPQGSHWSAIPAACQKWLRSAQPQLLNSGSFTLPKMMQSITHTLYSKSLMSPATTSRIDPRTAQFTDSKFIMCSIATADQSRSSESTFITTSATCSLSSSTCVPQWHQGDLTGAYSGRCGLAAAPVWLVVGDTMVGSDTSTSITGCNGNSTTGCSIIGCNNIGGTGSTIGSSTSGYSSVGCSDSIIGCSIIGFCGIGYSGISCSSSGNIVGSISGCSIIGYTGSSIGCSTLGCNSIGCSGSTIGCSSIGYTGSIFNCSTPGCSSIGCTGSIISCSTPGCISIGCIPGCSIISYTGCGTLSCSSIIGRSGRFIICSTPGCSSIVGRNGSFIISSTPGCSSIDCSNISDGGTSRCSNTCTSGATAELACDIRRVICSVCGLPLASDTEAVGTAQAEAVGTAQAAVGTAQAEAVGLASAMLVPSVNGMLMLPFARLTTSSVSHACSTSSCRNTDCVFTGRYANDYSVTGCSGTDRRNDTRSYTDSRVTGTDIGLNTSQAGSPGVATAVTWTAVLPTPIAAPEFITTALAFPMVASETVTAALAATAVPEVAPALTAALAATAAPEVARRAAPASSSTSDCNTTVGSDSSWHCSQSAGCISMADGGADNLCWQSSMTAPHDGSMTSECAAQGGEFTDTEPHTVGFRCTTDNTIGTNDEWAGCSGSVCNNCEPCITVDDKCSSTGLSAHRTRACSSGSTVVKETRVMMFRSSTWLTPHGFSAGMATLNAFYCSSQGGDTVSAQSMDIQSSISGCNIGTNCRSVTGCNFTRHRWPHISLSSRSLHTIGHSSHIISYSPHTIDTGIYVCNSSGCRCINSCIDLGRSTTGCSSLSDYNGSECSCVEGYRVSGCSTKCSIHGFGSQTPAVLATSAVAPKPASIMCCAACGALSDALHHSTERVLGTTQNTA